jgi:glycosyltransferase involved in cell wall biosynthesis
MTIEQRLPLSVCMISGAEAHRIRRALDSVAGWTSEIIVVVNDDVSDGTDRIAASYGARVFREPWKGHIAQKNSAADKAAQPWILGLDADEVVPPPLRSEIAELLAGSGPPGKAVACSFPRCSFYCGRWIRHGDWYPDRQTRLWQRGHAHWGGIDPHDKLLVDGPVNQLRHDLWHYTVETINHQIIKTMKYADDFARHCVEQNQTVTFLDLLVRPAWRFWRAYLFRLGFLDGWQGFAIAWLTAFYTFLRYLRAREAQLDQQTPR